MRRREVDRQLKQFVKERLRKFKDPAGARRIGPVDVPSGDIEHQAIGQLPAFVDDGLQIGAIRVFPLCVLKAGWWRSAHAYLWRCDFGIYNHDKIGDIAGLGMLWIQGFQFGGRLSTRADPLPPKIAALS